VKENGGEEDLINIHKGIDWQANKVNFDSKVQSAFNSCELSRITFIGLAVLLVACILLIIVFVAMNRPYY